MKNLNEEIAKLESMRDSLYSITQSVKLANEQLQQNSDGPMLAWIGEIYEDEDSSAEERYLIFAKTEEEAKLILQKLADENYYEYNYQVFPQEIKNGAINIDELV